MVYRRNKLENEEEKIGMIKSSCLAALILLIGSSMILSASAQEQVSQTIYVHEGDFNGTLLSGVQVTGQDAAGNSFGGMTDSNGIVVVNGQPGTWQFAFTKEGYESLDLSYDVTETGEGAVYLDVSSQSQEQVSQTVYVYEGDLNGTLLSGVQVAGQDAAGNSFGGMTDSNGVVVVKGQPGTWLFVFMKDGYESLDLSYDVTETGDGAVYLVRSDQTNEQIAPYQNNQQPGAISESTAAYETQLGPNATLLEVPESYQEQEGLNPTVSQNSEINESESAYTEFWLEEGNSLYEQGRYNEAVQFYDRAILINPQLETAWFNKGNALYMQGNYEEALQVFDKAIEINPQDAITWNCRGLTLIKLGRTVEANESFAKAKELVYTG